MIFRDDDICSTTDLERFKAVDSLFIKYGVEHTIAVICEDLENNPALITYINSHPHINVQLHCWQHIELAKNTDILDDHIKKSIQKIKLLFNKIPTILYPPWNMRDQPEELVDKVASIAKKNGLTVSREKTSLSYYIRANGKVKQDVINFHYWSDEETHHDLNEALRIYTQ